MTLRWFDSRQATELGYALADSFAPKGAPGLKTTSQKDNPRDKARALEELFKLADRDVRGLRLNLYKKAKFANSFKWRLLENGVDKDVADELTRALLMHLSQNQAAVPKRTPSPPSASGPMLRSGPSVRTSEPGEKGQPDNLKRLLAQGAKSFAAGKFVEASAAYESALELDPDNVDAMNNLGASCSRIGRYPEAETLFRQVLELKPASPDAHFNLGTLLRWKGDMAASETSLRLALKLKPNHVDARYGLGLTLLYLGRVRDAKARFEKVLKAAPRHADALYGMGQLANLEGRFEDARKFFDRALESNPKLSGAWAAIAYAKKMTLQDGDWLAKVEELASSAHSPLEEASLRFAMGKYFDDTGQFERAFENYKRGNELQRGNAEPYDRAARSNFVNAIVKSASREQISAAAETGDGSAKPVFVVGMMRSGTSLVEQIIASHPRAAGAGELSFWSDLARRQTHPGLFDAATGRQGAGDYLRLLSGVSVDAERVADKAPLNADHLGLIHATFPRARIIHMRRDPIDSCLSSYFQQFAPSLNFALDLSDLAHYYSEQQRLMKHWLSALPPGTILEVPYVELVADPETWTRRILDFLGLEWDPRCLDFQKTKRSVVTASAWQVRQKVYTGSVGRWRNYEKFIGPLKGLED